MRYTNLWNKSISIYNIIGEVHFDNVDEHIQTFI